MSRNGLTILIVLIILAVLVTAFDIWPRAWAPSAPEGEQVVCTMDAMQCPDGTWVGRTGPNCQFVCPGQ